MPWLRAGACVPRANHSSVPCSPPREELRAGEAPRGKERLSLSCSLQLLGGKRRTGGGEGELSFLAGLVFAASVLIRLSGEDPVSEQVSTQGFLRTKVVGIVPSLYLLCPASLDLSKENASTDVALLADLGEKSINGRERHRPNAGSRSQRAPPRGPSRARRRGRCVGFQQFWQ